MKRSLFYLIALWLGMATLYAQDGRFQQEGQRMLGLNGLSFSYADLPNSNVSQLNQMNLTFQTGKFYEDQKMRGLRLSYGMTNPVPGTLSAPASQHYSAYAFKRRYMGDGRFSPFAEIGLGGAYSTISDPIQPSGQRAYWDAFGETRLGLSARLGRHLGVEISGGVRLGTEGPSAEMSHGLHSRWVTGWGINYFFGR